MTAHVALPLSLSCLTANALDGAWQIIGTNGLTIREDDGMFEHVGKFPDVAWPWVALQESDSFGWEDLFWECVFAEMSGEQVTQIVRLKRVLFN